METMQVPQGRFRLGRYPWVRRDPLRAWDAADEYLLRHLDAEGLLAAGDRVLVVNDGFGAMAVALSAAHRVTAWSDSYLAHRGIGENLTRNGFEPRRVALCQSVADPTGPFTWILLKLPRSHALLEDQLHRLRPLLAAGAMLLAAGMARHVHRSTLALFERIIGPSPTSLAWRKARLILPRLDVGLHPGPSPWPKRVHLDEPGLTVVHHAAVFSRDRLDIGTRFFLHHLPRVDAGADVVDLGCGNGIVGLVAKRLNPSARLLFSDESFMALASAQANWRAHYGEAGARFVADDCLGAQPARSADLVLVNPPFHQQQAVTTAVARRMFRDARRVLRPGGELRIIGNRHLGYHRDLRRLFGGSEIVASNPKFVICRARKG